jgi:hypothetical protein
MSPTRRWVGYALLAYGVALLFDTYTFLRTNWSPLRVPMSVITELALGYTLVTLGLVVLLWPMLSYLVDDFAPDESMKFGQSLADQTV